MTDVVQRQIDHLRSFVNGERQDALQWVWDSCDLRSEWIASGPIGWDPLSAWFEQIGYVVDEFRDGPPPYEPGTYGADGCRELVAGLLEQAEQLGLIEPAAARSVSPGGAARGRRPGPGRTGARRRSARARRGWRPS